MTELGDYIRSGRNERDMSLERLAREATKLVGYDIRFQYIRKIEAGEIIKPAPDRLWAIARILDLPMSEILFRLPGTVGDSYRSAIAEGVAHHQPYICRLDNPTEGDSLVPVPPEWLNGRAPEDCFVLQATTCGLPGIPKGFLVLFEELRGTPPNVGDVVVIETERGWWMCVWENQIDMEPRGRKLKVWEA